MIEEEISKITEENLQSLKDNAVPEGKTIEYKQSLPSDAEKAEFLADVSSFANASGGDLIFGIIQDKDTSAPRSIAGINGGGIDQEILRLEHIIRTGIEPRIAVHTKPIQLQSSKFVLIMRIPQSWSGPHRIISNDRFYSRSSNGKYRLDVAELRNAFNLSETRLEKIRNFTLDRVSKILAGETPVLFYSNARIVLHLIPVVSFGPAQSYDISKIAEGHQEMRPIYSSGWSQRYNLDGLLSYSKDQQGKSYSYVQIFRSGIVEAVEGLLLEPHEGKLFIPSIAYEQELIKSFANYLSLLKALGVEPPILVFLDLLGIKGYLMAVNWRLREGYVIDRDLLLLPEIVVDSYDIKAEKVLKPCFDSIWNACGFSRSFNYNEAGEWAPHE